MIALACSRDHLVSMMRLAVRLGRLGIAHDASGRICEALVAVIACSEPDELAAAYRALDEALTEAGVDPMPPRHLN
jgi:hypothetical protein